jgi:predicted ATPase
MLVDAEILYQRGVGEQARYFFKHALIQDTAYQSLLKSTRQQYHTQIAQVLEERFPDTTANQPEVLAQHYTEAGLVEQAIPYWQQAGQRAAQRSANVEATNHFTKGLALLKLLPDDGQHVQQELAFQVALGALLMTTKDWAAPEVGLIYARARELSKQVSETPQLAPVLWGLSSFYAMKGDVQVATELAEQLMRLAQSTQDLPALILAHRVYGVGLYWRGEFLSALDHFKQVLTSYEHQKQPTQAFLSVLDSAILCRGYEAGTLWCLGYPDQALKQIHEALVSAQEMSHPNSLTYAHGWATLVHHHRRDVQAVQEQARLLIALCTELQFLFFLPRGRLLYAWAQVEQGAGEEGLAQIRQGLKAEGAMRTGLDRTYYLALAIEVCSKMGLVEEGLQLVAEALDLINDGGRRAFAPELYRLKGELTLQSSVQRLASSVTSTQHQTPSTPAEAEAETCFRKAIDIAQQQQAKSLELRAAMSLARLWQSQGKHHAARNMLSDIYGWFTEGFDTKDLQEAQALLEALASGGG